MFLFHKDFFTVNRHFFLLGICFTNKLTRAAVMTEINVNVFPLFIIPPVGIGHTFGGFKAKPVMRRTTKTDNEM